MSDREHLEALVYAIENLAQQEDTKYSIYAGAASSVSSALQSELSKTSNPKVEFCNRGLHSPDQAIV